MKIEVKRQKDAKVSPTTQRKRINLKMDTDNMTPEEKEKFNKTFEMLRTEDEYEIRAWRASGGEDPYILFQGTKEACETEYAKLKRILTTSES